MKLRILDDNGVVWVWDVAEEWLKVEGDDTEGAGEWVGDVYDVIETLRVGGYIEG